MKKFLLAVACFFGSALFADVEVVNNTPYPIKFSMKWIGLVPYAGAGTAWVEEANWPEEIQPGQSVFKGGELWNQKTYYKIQAKKGAHWETAKEKIVAEGGNRRLTVISSKPDQTTGIIEYDIISALR